MFGVPWVHFLLTRTSTSISEERSDILRPRFVFLWLLFRRRHYKACFDEVECRSGIRCCNQNEIAGTLVVRFAVMLSGVYTGERGAQAEDDVAAVE